jgi:uncharacterized protein
MNCKLILQGILVVCTLVIGGGCNSGNAAEETLVIVNDQRYFESIRKQRAQNNLYFLGPDSPLSDSMKLNFEAVNYFPVDTQFRVMAKFEESNDDNTFQFATTGSKADTYRLAGVLSFFLQQKACKLNLYVNVTDSEKDVVFYFLPFFDLTNGKTTYGGGRYMDFETKPGAQLILDFNTAYQPYCYYNHDYSCPIPPLENNVPLEVKAGERM